MRYLLPYAFARSAQLLLAESAGRLTLWVSEGSQRQALGEVLRCHGVHAGAHSAPHCSHCRSDLSRYRGGE